MAPFGFGFFAALILPLAVPLAEDAPGPALVRLVAEHWEDELARDPLSATFFGDHRHDDRLPDLSLDAQDAALARDRARRAALDAIDPAGLNDDQRLEWTLLRHVLDDRIALARFRGHLMPLTFIEGLPIELPDLLDVHPRSTVGDLENLLRRLHAFPAAVEAFRAVLRRGMEEGRMPARASVAKVPALLRGSAAPKAEDTPLWGLSRGLPDHLAEADRRAFVDHLRDVLETEVAPAYGRLAEFVETTYLPACRVTDGLWDTPDGRAYYAERARHYTTTDLTPEAIHQLGLAEVAKTRDAMDAIRRRVGFDGDLPAFLLQIQADPARRNADEAALLARYRALVAEMQGRLPELFGRLPRAEVVVRPYDPQAAETAGAGSYSSAPPDGSRPAYFFVNAANAATQPTYTMRALAHHEAVPGHHLQLGLAREASGRSAFRRNTDFTAFVEGWALYAEGLAADLKMEADPYEELGRLKADLNRSARLVVDTGLHHKGWTRDRAIAYLESLARDPRPRIERAVDRYIAWPGQALAYKIGELRIRAIRARAERRDGPAFDLRAFHDRLLSEGALPLDLLDARMAEPAR